MSARDVAAAVIRRQGACSAALGLLCVGATAVYSLSQRDLFQSTVTAVYDQRDSIGAPSSPTRGARFEQVGSTLKARLEEPEFLWQVARAVELSLDPVNQTPLADDSGTKARVAALLAPTLRAEVDPQGETLSVKALAEDALTAKRLADAAMEIFIQKELRFEAETFHRLYEAHARYLDDERKLLSPPSDANAPEAPRDGEGEGGLARIEERVRELDLERRRLTAQIESPAERTRLRVSVPATYDDIPVKRARRRAAWTLSAVSLLVVLGYGAYREIATPFARSGHRVRRAMDLPVLAEVPRSVLRRFPLMTRERAAALRESAKVEPARGPAAIAWQTYQAVDRALTRAAVGPVLLFVAPGLDGGTRAFVHNLLCVTALDASHPRLVLDGDARDPLGTADERRRARGDLGTFLAGKASWKDVRITRTLARPYDLVLTSPSDGDGQSPYPEDLLARLFTSLVRGYSRIFVRAHEPRHEVEVAALARAATDCVLVADARTTRLADLTRTREIVGAAKVRGVILLGT